MTNNETQPKYVTNQFIQGKKKLHTYRIINLQILFLRKNTI